MAQAQRKDTIICSRDKDLRQVFGYHYGWENWKQPSFGPTYISWEEGRMNFYLQLLIGDSADNIPGLPNIGKKKAERNLFHWRGVKLAFMEVKKAYYHQWGLQWEKHLTEQGQLLYLHRNRNSEMWTPTIEEEII